MYNSFRNFDNLFSLSFQFLSQFVYCVLIHQPRDVAQGGPRGPHREAQVVALVLLVGIAEEASDDLDSDAGMLWYHGSRN